MEDDFSTDDKILMTCTEHMLPPRFFVPSDKKIEIEGIMTTVSKEVTEEEWLEYWKDRNIGSNNVAYGNYATDFSVTEGETIGTIINAGSSAENHEL